MASEIMGGSEKDQEKEDELGTSWSQLLPELLCLVSSHLLVGDFTAFSSVCKFWRSSTSLIRSVPPLINSPYSLSPCLMSVDYHKCSFYHPTYHGFGHTKFPELLGARIRFSRYGWLLLTRNDMTVFFFNPFTEVKIELPKHSEWKGGFDKICFSSPPTSSDCYVLGICFPGTMFGVIRRGEESWTFCEIKGRDFQIPRLNCNLILCNGLCYCLKLETATVCVFDPNVNPSQWTSYAPRTVPPQRLLDSREKYLVESDDGKFLIVFKVDGDETPIYVFEMSLPNLRKTEGRKHRKINWRRVRSLGDKLLYISPVGSFLEPAMTRGTSNKIYLPMIRDSKNVFYSLNSAMYQSFMGDYSSGNCYNVQELRNCCWIKGMPTVDINQDFEW